jgi:hypothetical protein
VLFGCEHPFDAGSGPVALSLPSGDLGGQLPNAFDTAIETLGGQHADLDLDHVPPAE